MIAKNNKDFIDALRVLWDCWPIVEVLIERIDELEEACKKEWNIDYANYLFFAKKQRGELANYVEFVYKMEKEGHFDGISAKEIVNAFHDETMDLSTLECTGDDFHPWED